MGVSELLNPEPIDTNIEMSDYVCDITICVMWLMVMYQMIRFVGSPSVGFVSFFGVVWALVLWLLAVRGSDLLNAGTPTEILLV